MKNNILKSFLTLLLGVLFTAGMYAQTVNGTVTSSDGPLPGATVQVKGTNSGTTTDFDGNFSVSASANDVLVVSFVGYVTQEVAVGNQDQITVTLEADNELEEVVVTGYGSQKQKEITSAVVQVTTEEFNKGTINNASQLLQGKVAGLQIYNRGGNPNSNGVIRLRGISTVGANAQPLVVIDGIIGASLDNVDPADIESVNVLKDGSAAAIYGSRGSAGVILVTTKRGKSGETQFEYNGQYATSIIASTIPVLTASEFTSGNFGLQGFDAGSSTDWLDEVSQDATTMIHNISAAGGSGNTVYRISANIRDVDGVMINTGFDQFNTRASLQSTAFDDKLKISFNTSYTRKEQAFGFNEAFRYALLYNPSAPVYAADAPAQLAISETLYGGYFEAEGLFDSFNPVSMLEQNTNEGERIEFNYGLNLDYSLTDNLTATVNLANQSIRFNSRQYYAPTSLFRGFATNPIGKGQARFYDEERNFTLFEAYGRYNNTFGNVNLAITGGYSFQENDFFSKNLNLRGFPSNGANFVYALEDAYGLIEGGEFVESSSDASPDERIIAYFGRANVTIDDAIFINASLRREGSTKLGADNRWGNFPAFGLGVDLNKYLDFAGVDLLKVRAGYGVTGALPRQNGLSREVYDIVPDASGSFSSSAVRPNNPDLKWEEKAETNIGVEFKANKLGVTVDYYTREIKDFILEVNTDVAVTGFPTAIVNAGSLTTNGFELAVNYDFVDNANMSYTTGVLLSTTESTLDEWIFDGITTRANLGAPGQNATELIKVQAGDIIGDIWGPVYAGTVTDGVQNFVDVNGDGQLITGGDQGTNPEADYAVLGNGIPDFELGWTNQLSFGRWNVNAFFRGAFGHSLVNSFRAFYEPRVATQGSYNLVNTKLAINELTQPQFSSLYVEKADFFKLDNLTITRSFDMSNVSAIDALTLSLTGQNLFVITDYTGTDPEPSLIDSGAADNGGFDNGDGVNADVLAPGIDRRNNYFFSRTFTVGVNLKF